MTVSLSWEAFPIADPIRKSLEEQGFENPTPIQAEALKASLIDNKHVLGAARTGSGKTLAYAIPVINRILSEDDSSSQLKRRICKSQKKKEDFDIIDGDMVSIEDMIIDGEQESLEGDDDELSDVEQGRLCPDAIVLVPTRELAVQVKEEIDKICSNTDIRTCVIIGGISQDKQVKKLKRIKPQIIIATPGRLYEIVQSDIVDYLNMQSIASVQTLVIDEADRMVQKGHFEEMIKIVDSIKESKSFRGDQFPYKVYLFSATLTFLHELPDRFKKDTSSAKRSKKSKLDPKDHTKKNKIKKLLNLFDIEQSQTCVIDLKDGSFGRPNSDQLSEFRVNCVPHDKDLYLYYFLTRHPDSRTLVFCNSKDCLRRLANVFKFLGYEILKLHSEMDQKKRLSSLEKFRARSNAVLIATDIAARGLDIKDLENVVHYQVPRTCESYIHRSGRTARVNQSGTCLTLIEPKEVPFYRRLCNNINQGKDLDDYEVDLDLKQLLKSRVALAQQCDKLDYKLREKRCNQDWFTKAAKECDIELDERDFAQDDEKVARDKRQLAHFQKLLKKSMSRESHLEKYLTRQAQ